MLGFGPNAVNLEPVPTLPHAVFAGLNADRVGASRRELDGVGLLQPRRLVLPAPARQATSDTVFEIDEQPGRRTDRIDGSLTQVNRVGKLHPSRVVVLRVRSRTQSKPYVIRRVRGCGKCGLDIVGEGDASGLSTEDQPRSTLPRSWPPAALLSVVSAQLPLSRVKSDA
jgi:hypothetical protein